MGNQGRDTQTDEVLWVSRREVARPGPRAGAPLGPSRTLPTLKRVALSPTGGPRSGILDNKFGQKADMAPPNLLFLAGTSAVSLESVDIMSASLLPRLKTNPTLPTATPAIDLARRRVVNGQHAACRTQHLVPRTSLAHNFQVMGARRAEGLPG